MIFQGEKSHHDQRQGVLAEQGAAYGVQYQSQQPGGTEAHPLGQCQAPVNQYQTQPVGMEGFDPGRQGDTGEYKGDHAAEQNHPVQTLERSQLRAVAQCDPK